MSARSPYAEFARLRRDAPVTWLPEVPPDSGFWSVHRYDDIVTDPPDHTKLRKIVSP